jgi:ribosomal protein L29
MKYKEIETKNADELQKMLDELYKDLMKDYVQISAGTTPKSPGAVRNRKKSIAKVKAALNAKKGDAQ